MNRLVSLMVLVWLCWIKPVSAASLRLSYSIVGPPVAAVWMTHETGAFKRSVSMFNWFTSRPA